MFESWAAWRKFFEDPQNTGQNLAKNTPRDVGIDPLYVSWAKVSACLGNHCDEKRKKNEPSHTQNFYCANFYY